MQQSKPPNNRRSKQPYFPTPQTLLDQRTSFSQDNPLCIQHSNPLQLICIHCHNKLLCPLCIQTSLHTSHQIRNLQRSKQLILSQYQQWMVRLSSKSQILDIIHIQFESNKSQMISFSRMYKEKIKEEFQEISTYLWSKLQGLIGNIDGFVREYLFQMSSHMQKIRSQRKEIERIIGKYDKERIQNISIFQLAGYSYQIRGKITGLLEENNIVDYKGKLFEPQWRINYDVLKEIKDNIDLISIKFKDIPNKGIQEQKGGKKNKKDIKNDEKDRSQNKNKIKNFSSTNLLHHNTLTPKNKSKQRKVKTKKSPQAELLKKLKKSSTKMISMPASPAKEVQTTYLITPQLSRKKLFKKK